MQDIKDDYSTRNIKKQHGKMPSSQPNMMYGLACALGYTTHDWCQNYQFHFYKTPVILCLSTYPKDEHLHQTKSQHQNHTTQN